jgi:hypothetical protein
MFGGAVQSAVRAMAKEWQILKRSRSRHRTRRAIEAVGARIVGACEVADVLLWPLALVFCSQVCCAVTK